jgi:DNA-binding beta-propeller fold protein YncE
MSKVFRPIVIAALVVWLAHTIISSKVSSVVSAAAQAQGQAARKTILLQRPPLRFIHDPYPTFAAVAVDNDANMLVATDENLFQILQYGVLENTPAKAKFSEPTRVISGTNTRAEMICGVYIDPKTRDVYVMNNDTQEYIPVFGPDQKGNAQPERYLAGTRGFGIAGDEETGLLYLTNESGTISVYPKQFTSHTKPLWKIEGNDTLLEDPHGITLDTKNKLIYVSNFGNEVITRPGNPAGGYGKFDYPSVTVYPLDGKGDIKPVRVIKGPKTLMNWPSHIVLDVKRQELFVANDGDSSIEVFKAGDDGDVAPIRVIKGPKTDLSHSTGIALDEKLNDIYVANMGNSSITVFPVTANGDVAPIRTIRGAPTGTKGLMIGNPGAVGYDSKRGQILVPN